MKNCFQVKTGGYIVFHLSNGAGGYAVELRKTGRESKGKIVFDSRKLNENDLFVATPLRPGTYDITNVETKKKAELVVAYPEIGQIPKQPQATKVECNQNAIIPKKIKINPTESLLFSFNGTFKNQNRSRQTGRSPTSCRAKKGRKTCERTFKCFCFKTEANTPSALIRLSLNLIQQISFIEWFWLLPRHIIF